MGCDIHLKLEMKKNGQTEWESVRLTRYENWSDRIYGMFARLAGVRNYGDKVQIVPDRGFPDDACDDTKTAYSYIVVSDEEWEEKKSYFESSRLYYVKESRANDWVESGYSQEMKPFGNIKFKKITGPDWHTPNWCTTNEMEKCIKDCFYNKEGKIYPHADYIEWFALLGAMKGVEQSGEYECRAVFWFDN